MNRTSFMPPGPLVTERSRLSGQEDGSLIQADNVTHRVPGQLTARPGLTASATTEAVASTEVAVLGKVGESHTVQIVQSIAPTASDTTAATKWDGTTTTALTNLGDAKLGSDWIGQGADTFDAYYHPTVSGVKVLRGSSATAFETAGIGAPAVGGAPSTDSPTSLLVRYGYRYAATLYRKAGARAVESAPSPELLIYVASGSNASQVFILPPDATAGDELRLYQSEPVTTPSVTTANLNTVTAIPSRQMRYGTSVVLSAANIAAKKVAVTWKPESLSSGAALYTGDDQEGVAATNEIPPICDVMEPFAGSMFYGNARPGPFMSFQAALPYAVILDEGSEGGNAATVDFTASSNDGAVTVVHADAIDPSEYTNAYMANDVSVVDGEATFTALRVASYSAPNLTFASSATATESSVPFAVWFPMTVSWVNADGTSDSVSSILPITDTGLTYELTGTINRQLAASPVRCSVYIDPNRPQQSGGDNTVSLVGSQALYPTSDGLTWEFSTPPSVSSISVSIYNVYGFGNTTPYATPIVAGPGLVEGAVGWTLTNSGAGYNDLSVGLFTLSPPTSPPGVVAWSKFELPEAVPPTNYESPGLIGEPVIGMKASRDGLFVFKDSGIYKMTGNALSGFDTRQVSNARLLHRTSCTAYDNSVFAWTDQGVGRVSDSGFENLSRGFIGDQLLSRINATLADRIGLLRPPLVRAHPVEHELYCFDGGTTAYVYSFRTGHWSRFTNLPPIRDGIFARNLGMVWGGGLTRMPGYGAAELAALQLLFPAYTTDQDMWEFLAPTLPYGVAYSIANNFREATTTLGPAAVHINLDTFQTNVTAGDVLTYTGGVRIADTPTTYFQDLPSGTLSAQAAAPIVTIEFSPMTLGDPGAYKRFTQGSILLENAKGLMVKQVLARDEDSGTYYTCEQDIDTTAEIDTDLPTRFRFLLPRQVSFGYRLGIRVVLAGNGTGFFSMNGIELTGRVVGRHAKRD